MRRPSMRRPLSANSVQAAARSQSHGSNGNAWSSREIAEATRKWQLGQITRKHESFRFGILCIRHWTTMKCRTRATLSRFDFGYGCSCLHFNEPVGIQETADKQQCDWWRVPLFNSALQRTSEMSEILGSN